MYSDAHSRVACPLQPQASPGSKSGGAPIPNQAVPLILFTRTRGTPIGVSGYLIGNRDQKSYLFALSVTEQRHSFKCSIDLIASGGGRSICLLPAEFPKEQKMPVY